VTRVLVLYRPRLPSLRAQAIQVTHAAHALAARGFAVTVLADRGGAGDPLASFGLEPVAGLDLHVAPSAHPTLAGLWFRAEVLRWWAGAPGIVIARDKRRLRRLQALGRRHAFVLETHELDSALAAEAGRDPEPLRALEAAVARGVDAIIANCGGTIALWEQHHALPERRGVAHNATSASRRRDRHEPDGTIRIVGSTGDYKGVAAWSDTPLPLPLQIVGDPTTAVPYPEVPDLLARSSALVLPLQDNLFGRSLTSPLKLWDYLATPTPLVLPDLPAIREIVAIARRDVAWYHPARPETFAIGVATALAMGSRPPFVRTWADRAAEVERLLP
jgi:hypothetical protein